MCSINGIFFPNRLTSNDYDASDQGAMKRALLVAIEQSTERGKDGFGVSIYFKEDSQHYTPRPTHIRYDANAADIVCFHEGFKAIIDSLNLNKIRCIITQNRAEPTTEVKKEKNELCIPPLIVRDTIVAHNGTIANDKEIAEKYDFEIDENWIDSKAIALAFSNCMMDEGPKHHQEALERLIGSMSISVYDPNNDTLLLYRNYREMHIRQYRGAYFWSSKEKYFSSYFRDHSNEVKIAPYQGLIFKSFGHADTFTYPEREGKDKAYVVCSSGLDSTTVAKIACSDPALREVRLVHCLYKCKAEKRERNQFVKIAKRLQLEHPEKIVKYGFIDMTWLHSVGGSSLTVADRDINTEGDGESGSEFAHEWVPFRNGAMIAMVAAMCDAHNIGNIYLGLNLEEAGAYPDNTTEFFEKFNEVLAAGSKSRPVIVNPLANLVKHEIVAWGLRTKAPIDLSWSCYHGGKKHCGRCGPCYMRKKAFAMNNVPDMMEYEYEGISENE